MRDLQDPRLMYLKAGLLLVIGIIGLGYIAIRTQDWLVVAAAALIAWAFCRAYYFVFYVVQHYIDPEYRFDGLWSFARYALRHRDKRDT